MKGRDGLTEGWRLSRYYMAGLCFVVYFRLGSSSIWNGESRDIITEFIQHHGNPALNVFR